MTASARAPSFVALDVGTTTTRAWLVDRGRIVGRHQAAAGARDTAREGEDARLRASVRSAIAEVVAGRGDAPEPRLIAAAGMIGSPSGLLAVPHVLAPAGVAELAAGAREAVLSDVSALPLIVVPGVRTVAVPGRAEGVGATDVMRGEETLALGLLRTGALAPPAALLTVGSHWKLVSIDDAGRIASSVTSLAGEMFQAVRRETILASAVPAGRPDSLDRDGLRDGLDEVRRSGLGRAVFCVRLLELEGRTTPEQRLSFLIGAFVGAEMDTLLARGVVAPGNPIAVAGDEKVGGAWTVVLEGRGFPTRPIPPEAVEAGLIAGLTAVVEARSR